MSWSPLAGAGDVSGAMEAAAEVLHEAAPFQWGADATYWSAKGQALLWPVLFAAAIGGRTMADVVRWLAVEDGNQVTVSDDEDDPAELGGEIRGILRAAVAGGLPHAERVLAQFDRFCELDLRTRFDIYATAQTLVEPWADPCPSHAWSLHAGEA